MFVVVGLLLLGVVFLAVKSPDVNTNTQSQVLPPNENKPATGAVGNPSPAMANGAPSMSSAFRLAMGVNAGLVGDDERKFTAAGFVNPFNVRPGTFAPPTQTISEMGKALMTQAPPSLVAEPTGVPPGGYKIKL